MLQIEEMFPLYKKSFPKKEERYPANQGNVSNLIQKADPKKKENLAIIWGNVSNI